ncbi:MULTISPECIES: ABC transporter substrate-binding protein [unclassified Curtobacterium]|uniref:ABC transporter substrate-binding protein n=1 Tax=unclassified Curtobacterium TaxID=257496 RepID=UPI000DA72EC8|nr:MULTISPECIES: ABC transporter substrate-binding protein [unclassified Curtobacterium]PZE22924.1 ABC transporter substrate-binding protein [Curtobacterium sp. MCBD17_028]PZF55340.1 ABC transporter substrate-binding protein [Curtobacterium sp. MCBD17_034]PZM32773.1 ABC transporter substrate-binding protein [Curtobacterium sp. MCBD17_031]WIE56094.1 ABC transporter substrate-binding protein [Curtobacterium sp. MCBD17_003]
MRSRTRLGVVAAALGVTALALTGCSTSTSDSAGAATTSSAAKGPAVDLSGVCPSTVVVQTDWNPEADHGHLYQMLGANPKIDASGKSVTGDLMANGKSTGVQLEIRAGGPAIGYSTVSSQMYQDKSITLGYVSTDEAVEFSGNLPTTAVFAENDESPMVLMWDPATYKSVDSIKSLGKALKAKGGVVRYFSGAAYMTYLAQAGYLPTSVQDGSYDGTPSKFVTAGGKDAQQGFATAEPYIYQHEVAAWGKKLDSSLVSSTGWNPYPETMSVRSGDLAKLTPCLKKLVPVMQQADVDYFKNPTPTNDLIDTLVQDYNNGWTYDAKVGAFAVQQMKKLKVATDGSNGYVGDMDASRLNSFITKAAPIFEKSGGHVQSGLTADDLYTNQFIDKKIGFGF